MNYYIRRFLSFYLDMFIITFVQNLTLYYYTKFFLSADVMIDFPDLKLGIIFIIVGTLIYYLIFEGIFQTSIGKKVFGFQLIGLENIKTIDRLKRVFLRTISRFIPFEPISLFLEQEGKKMWHDSISKTKVELRKSK